MSIKGKTYNWHNCHQYNTISNQILYSIWSFLKYSEYILIIINRFIKFQLVHFITCIPNFATKLDISQKASIFVFKTQKYVNFKFQTLTLNVDKKSVLHSIYVRIACIFNSHSIFTFIFNSNGLWFYYLNSP